MIVAHGPSIARDRIVHGASIFDVAPTVLALFGRAFERVLGRVLDLDPETRTRLDAFEGRAIVVDFSGATQRGLPAMRIARMQVTQAIRAE